MQHYIANAICSVRFVTDAARPHRPTLRPGPLFTSAVYGTPQWCLLRSAMRNGCREGEIKTMGQGVPWAGDVCRGLGRDLGLCGAPPFKFYSRQPEASPHCWQTDHQEVSRDLYNHGLTDRGGLRSAKRCRLHGCSFISLLCVCESVCACVCTHTRAHSGGGLNFD
jgi:hypothetical protein